MSRFVSIPPIKIINTKHFDHTLPIDFINLVKITIIILQLVEYNQTFTTTLRKTTLEDFHLIGIDLPAE